MASKAVSTKATDTAPAASVPEAYKGRLVSVMATKFGVDPDKMMGTLKATAFRGEPDRPVTNEQMMALLVVAHEYNLNPWLKEIYAFPDKSGGIVPVIGVDGWIRMMNTHPQFRSQSFTYPEVDDDEIFPWIECVIERKDRDRPTVIREYFSEVKRNTGPWGSHPRRMLRHKALIQCIRIAFGFAGIYDPDEGERIANEIDITPRSTPKPTTEPPKAISNGQPARASVEQIEFIREQLSDAEVPIEDALGEFKLDSLDGLQFDQVQAMVDWILARQKRPTSRDPVEG